MSIKNALERRKSIEVFWAFGVFFLTIWHPAWLTELACWLIGAHFLRRADINFCFRQLSIEKNNRPVFSVFYEESYTVRRWYALSTSNKRVLILFSSCPPRRIASVFTALTCKMDQRFFKLCMILFLVQTSFLTLWFLNSQYTEANVLFDRFWRQFMTENLVWDGFLE